MNTQRSLRVRLGALAAAATLSGLLAATGTARADHSQFAPTHSVITQHQGPGTGSVKAPPFYDTASLNNRQQLAQLRGDLMFHTSDDLAAKRPARQILGPGPWSVKAPGIH